MYRLIVKQPLIFLLLTLVATRALAEDVKVAAAADLKFALDRVILDFEQTHPEYRVLATYGASGKLATQIGSGAPFDLFLSADTETAEKVARDQKTFPYAIGHLVAWVRNGCAVEPTKDLAYLREEGVRKIAVANPAHAPYGKIAEAAIRKAGLEKDVKNKLVLGESVAQAAQFAETGAADTGLIPKSLAASGQLKKEGHFVDVDASLYPELVQSGVLLRPRAKAFRDFFVGAIGRKTMRDLGFSPYEK